MIDFGKLTIEDREEFLEYAKVGIPANTYYSFATRLMWGETYVASFPGGMGFMYTYEDICGYMYPIGDVDVQSVIEAYIEDAKERGIHFSVDGMGRAECDILEELFPGRFEFHFNRDYSDYVYDINDLAGLKGRKYHKKKNHVNKFKSEFPDYKIEPITSDNFDDAKAVAKEWYRLRAIQNSNELVDSGTEENLKDDYAHEKIAIRTAFDNYEKFGMEGVLLYAGEKAIAMTMASRLSSDTLDVHFEKSIDEAGTAYAVINNEFANIMREKHPDIKYLDREEDMGLDGLRQAKESYHPHHMAEKYKAVLKINVSEKDKLINLWKESFGDSQEEVEKFFDSAFSKERYCTLQISNDGTIVDEGQIVSALYWLDYEFNGEKLAYIYAASTNVNYRNRGYFKKLIEKAHKQIKDAGYVGIILVPSSKELFEMYKKFGYEEALYKFDDVTVTPEGLIQTDIVEFAKLRKQMLPEDAAIPADYVYKYLDSFANFYKRDTEIFALSKDPSHKLIEHLSKENPPLSKGIPHGMFLPLKAVCQVPKYIGIDLA